MSNRREFLRTTFLGGLSMGYLSSSFTEESLFSEGKTRYLLNENFKNDPVLRGWEKKAATSASLAEWNSNKNGHYITAKASTWTSPGFNVEPYKYYKIAYSAKGINDGEICALFLDEKGNPCITDTYDLMFLSENLSKHILCFRAFALAKKCRVQLISRTSEIAVDSVSVEETDYIFVNKWRNEVLSQMPVISGSVSGKSQFYEKSRKKLKSGDRLRIVMLGDSTINDTGNSLYETSLHMQYPRVQIEVVNSVRGSTGCTWYQYENRINDFVLRFQPDMLIIGGISNGYDVNSIRSVIQQVRKSQNPDILVLTDSITPGPTLHKRFFDSNPGISQVTGNEIIRLYPEKLLAMTTEEKTDLLDIRAAWNAFTSSSLKPFEWFMRDEIHANSRGKQVVGQILLNYLSNAIK